MPSSKRTPLPTRPQQREAIDRTEAVGCHIAPRPPDRCRETRNREPITHPNQISDRSDNGHASAKELPCPRHLECVRIMLAGSTTGCS